MSANIFIGIDPGVNTGFATLSDGRFHKIQTMTIIEAQEYVLQLHEATQIYVRVEDARKRTWFGSKGKEALQGAGSIKRDCQVWEEFLTHYNISHEFVAPKDNTTKLDAKRFNLVTGWKGRTSEHARDAAGLLFRYLKAA